jgi:hypothetical protein
MGNHILQTNSRTPAGESLSPNEGTAVSFHGNLVYPKW